MTAEVQHADMIEVAELVNIYPLFPYASRHFLWHIKSIPSADPLWLLFAETAGKYSIYNLKAPQAGEKSSVPSDNAKSPLQYIIGGVAGRSALNLIRKFQNHGYDIDEKWSAHGSGRPLQYCCVYAAGSNFLREAAHLLLELGANPNLPEGPQRSNLGLALQGKMWDLYDTLLCHSMTDLSARNTRGETLLHDLVRLGPNERIAELLDMISEIDVNSQDHEGYAPLHLATVLERQDAVRMLLGKPGIRLDLTDNNGRTPLTLATYWGLKKMALVLIEHSEAFPIATEDQLSALVVSAKRGDKDMCLQLLEVCQFRNLSFHLDMSGKGILHHAAMNDWSDVIETCLRRGGQTINVNQIDHSGRSALHYASRLGNVESCRALIIGGASLTLQDRLGRTAAQDAADAGFKDALMLLLRSGLVDPSQRDLEGRNLVHWAATLDCVDVMEMISQMPGVRLDQRDRHGKTPIDIAFICQSKHVGLFLADRVPHLNMYSWDLMYRTPAVDDGEHHVDLNSIWEDDLLARNARRQQIAHAEYEKIQKQYPTRLWGLVRNETTGIYGAIAHREEQ